MIKNIKKTLQDINGLILSRDASIFEWFLGRNCVFRLDYQKVSENIFQLNNGKIK